MRRYVQIGLILVLAGQAFCQNAFPILGGQRVGTSVFTFLKIGVSARATGMSEAVVALNQDAASIYYNPAAVAQFAQTEFSASQIDWMADIKYDYVALTRHVYRRHYLGVSAGILHMEPMEETTEYLPQGTGNYFVFQDQFIGLTYGARMTDRFSFGLTVKHVKETLAEYAMDAVLLDLGTFYWTGYKDLRFSAALTHFGSQTKPDGYFSKFYLDNNTGEETVNDSASFTEFSPPAMFRVGAAISLVDNDLHNLTMALQLNHPVDNSESIALGAEYTVFDILCLRGGYMLNRKEEDYSLGVGLLLPVGKKKLRVDYAYTKYNYLSDPTRITIGFSF